MGERARASRLLWALSGLIAAGAIFFATVAIAAQPLRGTLDRSFGHDGRVVTELGESFAGSEFTSMMRQPDGKLLLAATFEAADGSRQGMIQRRGESGALDTAFGSGGSVVASEIQGLAHREMGTSSLRRMTTTGVAGAGGWCA